jgi:peptidoglycan hydrolase-like protein with peptidoglycan-binding domain
MRRVLLAALLVAGCGGAAQASDPPVALSTASVETRDLVDRDSVSGTLGYADQGTVSASATGTLTRLPSAGDIVTRGHSLYSVDDKPAAFLFYGSLPAWRDFNASMSDGPDVWQLEHNLKALGYDPGTVDEDWTTATTAAVEDFQADRGLTETGTLARSAVVFRPGETRIGDVRATVGGAASGPIASVSSTRQQVTVMVDADRQELARLGERVTVELPNGRDTTGRITAVGKVATRAGVEVTVALRTRGTGLDQAPVDVGFEVEKRTNVLAVPVKALLARQGGGYAVETTDHRFISVTPGLYADDWVEIAGDVRAGQKVVTAQ